MPDPETEIREAFAELRRLEDRLGTVRKLAAEPDDDPYAGEQRSGNLFDQAF